jgi:hypothetical protein
MSNIVNILKNSYLDLKTLKVGKNKFHLNTINL